MKSRKIAFVTVFTGIFLFGVSMVIIGSTLPMLKEKFSLTDIAAGGLFSILPLGILIGSITFGPISDKYGYRWVLAVASLFLSAGFLGIAHANSINLLRFCILFFGIGGGVINGASSALVTDLSEKNPIANLNWLGVFFGIGAFCMPLLLSVIDKKHYVTVIDVVSIISFLIAIVFMLISYPLTVKKEEISLKVIPAFLKNKWFLAICFYLFFQSAFEAIINNWSVSYFIEKIQVEQHLALIALSSSVLGMTLMRILSGSVLKNLSYKRLVQVALMLLTIGLFFLIVPASFYVHVFGLFLIGAGLAPGFPVMLGLAGNIYKEISGTAFSFALFIALIGNMLINYITGFLSQKYGMGVFPFVILTEIILMSLIFILIVKNDKTSKK